MNFKRTFTFLNIVLLLLLASCHSKPKPIPNSILFLGHTYSSDTKVDPRLEKLNLDQYEHIWLGGDICARTDNQQSTLDYVEDLFDVCDPHNYWALGNHDIGSGNLDWIENVTKRKPFYTTEHKGMTIMVLNTIWEPPHCEELEAQYQMVQAVFDTIQSSSHLIILSHTVIWNHVKGMPNLWKRANANNPFWETRCQPKSRFQDVMLPQLIEVQKRGVQIICIAGDYGQKEKTFQFQSSDGLWFLASGLDRSNYYMPDSLKARARDKVLVLDHSPEERTLAWSFQDLDSLAQH